MREDALLNRRLATVARVVGARVAGRPRRCSGLWVAPPDAVQGDAQRLMYLHVPAAWLAYLAFGVTALGLGLVPVAAHALTGLGPRRRRVGRARRHVHRAHAGARLPVGPAGVGHLVGVGRPARDDRRPLLPLPRLPRAAPHPAAPSRAKRCAIAALIAFVDVPIVHFSVDWWRTLHQEGTVFNDELKAQIHGMMAFTLWFGASSRSRSLYVYLLDRRYRLEALEEGREERELEQAIAERVASGDGDGSGGADALVDSGAPGDAAMTDAGYVVTGWVLTARGARRVLGVDRAAHPPGSAHPAAGREPGPAGREPSP